MPAMRVHAVSDLHVDYDENARWVEALSRSDFTHDALILAGDLSDVPERLERCFDALKQRFAQVLFMPGNHDLWVRGAPPGVTSLDKLAEVQAMAQRCEVAMHTLHLGDVSIVPMWSWYDFSFGTPGRELKMAWMDFRACRWPEGWHTREVAAHFLQRNEALEAPPAGQTVITFSHFLPRIDLMPERIPQDKRFIYPVLGSARLDAQLRRLRPSVHVYGHSHVNRRVTVDGITYVNNAFAYPNETRIAAKALVCVHGS